MKKVILILVLLIIAAGVCFYFGWVNVQPQTFYLAHSTLTGTIDYPLESGRFYWLWQKLVPKSFHLYRIETEPYTARFEFTLPLPGNEVLAEYGSFSLDGAVEVDYNVDFDTARKLLENGIIEGFEAYIEHGLSSRTQETLTAYLLDTLSDTSLVTEGFGYGSVELLRGLLLEEIAEYASRYDLRNVRSHVTFDSIPQIETYKKALASYFEFMEALAAEKSEDSRREMERKIRLAQEDLEIERLRKYGELITEYPSLLKYFYIQQLNDKVRVLVLPEDESGGFPRILESEIPRFEKELPPLETENEQIPPVFESDNEEPASGGLIDEGAGIPKDGEAAEEDDIPWYRYLMFWKFFTK
ncbi:MAG: hypothetical protein JXQ30_12720 [Spirochaetes bacterium]|nr:hypothetical protein [Spirochaetota bacterium]